MKVNEDARNGKEDKIKGNEVEMVKDWEVKEANEDLGVGIPAFIPILRLRSFGGPQGNFSQTSGTMTC